MAEEIKTVLTADQKPMEQAFAKAAATVKGYTARLEESRERAKRSARAEVVALLAESRGHTELARKIREKIKLETEAARLARRAGITEQEAAKLVQRRITLEAQLGRQRQANASRSVGLGGLGTNLQDLDRLRYQQQQVARGFNGMRNSAQRSAMGVLEVSRAFEDAQYGFRGVINNVPGIVQSFGGSMGIAGAVSIATVAFYQLGKAYKAWLEASEGGQGAAAYAEEWEKVHAAQMKAVSSGIRLREIQEDMAGILAKSKADADTTFGNVMVGGSTGRMLAQIDAREKELAITQKLEAAERKLAEARGQTSTTEGEAALRDLREELRLREDLAAAAEDSYDTLTKQSDQSREMFDFNIAAQQEALDALQKKLAGKEAQVEATKKALEEEKESGLKRMYGDNLAIFEEQLATLKDQVKTAEERLQTERDASGYARESAAAAKTALEAAIDGNAERRQQIEREVALKKQLLEIEKQTKEETEAIARLRFSLFGLDRASIAAMKDMASEAAKARKEEDRRATSRASFAAEAAALRLEAEGRKDMADALRREVKMREESVRLAKELGVSEQRALQLLRQKAALQQRIEDGEIGRNFGGPRGRGGASPSRGGGIQGATGIQGARSFREAELNRRDAERAARPRGPQKNGLEELAARQLGVQESLLQIWETIQKK